MKCSRSFRLNHLQRNLANREQTTLVVDIDDIARVDPELADAILDNSRRYIQIFSQVVQEMLPELKDKEVKIDSRIISMDMASFRSRIKMFWMSILNIEH